MKKFFAFLIACVLLISTMVGCARQPIVGTEAAKLLLAEERLNASLLQKKGDIFENGTAVMNTLAEKALANLGVQYVGTDAAMTNLSAMINTSTVLKGNYIGRVEVDGDTFTWRDFEENNNSYDYFKSITDSIVSSAKIAGDLIDSIKKNVRVVDKWVRMGDTEYHLQVDENSETLCERGDSFVTVCRRYKNLGGEDVYELYRKQDDVEERMTYIPGERYEHTLIMNGDGLYFVADSTKGYWETYIVGEAPQHFNVSYFIMKDDICYDAIYDPKSGLINVLKFMSADRATDILNFYDHGDSIAVDLKFSGFDGVESVVAPAGAVEYTPGEYANLTNGDGAEVRLTNGKVFRYGDVFYDGKLTVNAVHVIFGAAGYTGEAMLAINGETYEERIALLGAFLSDMGLRCRRDFPSVLRGIDRAYIELESLIRYYKWNGISVTDESGIIAAASVEDERLAAMEALYTDVKDDEVLDYADTKKLHLNINFAPITLASTDNAHANGTAMALGSISLTVEDTTLFVTNEPYKIALAMIDTAEANGLVHLDSATESTVVYTGEDTFTVNADGLTATLPVLSAGSYTVVAYISTADGIRASDYIEVDFHSVEGTSLPMSGVAMSTVLSESGALTVSYEPVTDFFVTLTTDTAVDYASFYGLLAAEAFNHGTPSEGTVERKTEDGYEPLVGDETVIADGTYRMAYVMQNGETTVEGFLYADYTRTAEEDPATEESETAEPS